MSLRSGQKQELQKESTQKEREKQLSSDSDSDSDSIDSIEVVNVESQYLVRLIEKVKNFYDSKIGLYGLTRDDDIENIANSLKNEGDLKIITERLRTFLEKFKKQVTGNISGPGETNFINKIDELQNELNNFSLEENVEISPPPLPPSQEDPDTFDPESPIFKNEQERNKGVNEKIDETAKTLDQYNLNLYHIETLKTIKQAIEAAYTANDEYKPKEGDYIGNFLVNISKQSVICAIYEGAIPMFKNNVYQETIQEYQEKGGDIANEIIGILNEQLKIAKQIVENTQNETIEHAEAAAEKAEAAANLAEFANSLMNKPMSSNELHKNVKEMKEIAKNLSDSEYKTKLFDLLKIDNEKVAEEVAEQTDLESHDGIESLHNKTLESIKRANEAANTVIYNYNSNNSDFIRKLLANIAEKSAYCAENEGAFPMIKNNVYETRIQEYQKEGGDVANKMIKKANEQLEIAEQIVKNTPNETIEHAKEAAEKAEAAANLAEFANSLMNTSISVNELQKMKEIASKLSNSTNKTILFNLFDLLEKNIKIDKQPENEAKDEITNQKVAAPTPPNVYNKNAIPQLKPAIKNTPISPPPTTNASTSTSTNTTKQAQAQVPTQPTKPIITDKNTHSFINALFDLLCNSTVLKCIILILCFFSGVYLLNVILKRRSKCPVNPPFGYDECADCDKPDGTCVLDVPIVTQSCSAPQNVV